MSADEYTTADTLEIDYWYTNPDDLHSALKINTQMCSIFTQSYIANSLKYDYPKVDLKKVELAETQFLPSRTTQIPLERKHARFVLDRGSSLRKFNDQMIQLSTLEVFFSQSFSQDKNRHRAYPSGGALYPVEVVLAFKEKRVEGHLEPGLYHYLPVSQSLEPIGSFSKTKQFDDLYQQGPLEGIPNFVIIYFINMPRAINKYGIRGFRHAMMEVGSMYQQAALVASELNLSNCLWSQFSDHKVSGICGLNPGVFTPCIIQHFGVNNK